MKQTHEIHKLTKPITRAEFEAMRQRIEDMGDRFDLLQAHARGPSEDALPGSFAKRIVNGEHPLRTWREFRAMILDQLSANATFALSISSFDIKVLPLHWKYFLSGQGWGIDQDAICRLSIKAVAESVDQFLAKHQKRY
jgi:hypothetical protein